MEYYICVKQNFVLFINFFAGYYEQSYLANTPPLYEDSGSRGEMAAAFFYKNLCQYLDKIEKWNTIYSVRINCSHKSLTLPDLKMSARADAGTSFIII